MSEENIVRGKVYKTNSFGPIVILDEAGMSKPTNGSKPVKMYRIRFLNTGHECTASRRSILGGGVKDCYYPTICDIGDHVKIGCLGEINDPGSHPVKNKGYNAWRHMLSRCYNPLDKSYNAYGGCDVTVDPDWFNFTNFMNDIRWIPGYDEWRNDPDYNLDKDFIQKGKQKKDKIYSKDTCCFIPGAINNIIRDEERIPKYYHGVSLDSNSYAYSTYRSRLTHDRVKYDLGRFTSPEAAAVVYNFYAKGFGKPINEGIDMTIADAFTYKVSKKPMKVMCVCIDD